MLDAWLIAARWRRWREGKGLTEGMQWATTAPNIYNGGIADLAEGSGLCKRFHGSMHACKLPVDDVAKGVDDGSLRHGRALEEPP
jgi:hypothetical protein